MIRYDLAQSGSNQIPDDEELTTEKLSKILKVSGRTIRRFERHKAFLPLVLKYADAIGMELQLTPVFSDEDYGAFYIHNCIALHTAALRNRQNKSQRG
jgi:hypothetical protein